MDIRTLRDKTVVVTGAGSGIGKETAVAFAQRGASLAIRALGCEVLAQRVDVANRHEMREFAAAVHQRVAAVDILMNNAGVGLGASFLDTPLDDWDWIMGINLMGVVHGCHFFLPPMVARQRGGHVVNVASAAAFAATEALSAYSTTKFAVVGLSEALRDELTPHGIGVTAVCPGIINTPITASTRMRGATATDAARQRIIEVYQRRNYGPERVAANILKAVQRNRAVAPVSPEAWFMYYLKRWCPGAVFRINRVVAARLRGERGGGN
jgi:NAD(P)-dependent dehydrogenase (short-subunit alcohol dehydrogenase family)